MRKIKKKNQRFKSKKPRNKRKSTRRARTMDERILRTLTRRITNTLKAKHLTLNGDPLEFLGCSAAELIRHLTEPHGGRFPAGYNIDHILPISVARTEKEVRKLTHHSNLRLMDEQENCRKGSQITTQEQLDLALKLLGRPVQMTTRVFTPHVIIPRKIPVEGKIFGWLIKNPLTSSLLSAILK